MATTNQQSENEAPSNCLLQLMKVRSGTSLRISLNILWDGGATISMITFSKATDKSLVGEPIKISVIKVGGQKQEMSSYLYKLPVANKKEKMVNLQVSEIDCISMEFSQKNIDNVLSLFRDLSHHEI